MTVGELEAELASLRAELLDRQARIVELETQLGETRDRVRGLRHGIHEQLRLWAGDL